MKFRFLFILFTLFSYAAHSHADTWQPRFSTAGFYEMPHTGRTVYSMNPAWRFYRGDVSEAWHTDCNDSAWQVVSLPHGIEYLPTEASGCVNYQGPVWYRKHFTPEEGWKGRKLFLHFEAIMGKADIWLNGHHLTTHLGGYLPMHLDVTPFIVWGRDNVIAVRADNSDNPAYPPGKPQDMLDFTYAGGIYRDCWLIAHRPVYITDPNAADHVAGGGVLVAYDRVSERSANIHLSTEVHNDLREQFDGKVVWQLTDSMGRVVRQWHKSLRIAPGRSETVSVDAIVTRPELWSPDHPYLYRLKIWVRDNHNKVVDGYYKRIGIRSIEFKGKDGFWLNGAPYPYPLIGANRHQDFAVIGNALSNSLHWRDAKKLRDAGLRVIRNAHYPQDPAFMDACDELGLFVIVNTPGWQFWNKEPSFARCVYSDIRNMVRRDRDHASVWLWEPILNETWYPEDFAQKVKHIVWEEFPYPSSYSGCDASAKGHEYFPVQFTHPLTGGGGAFNASKMDPSVTYFTREWGDNVDDWNSHNSPSRVYRGWGETPMLIQAQGYAHPSYKYTCYDVLWRQPRQHVGGCLWHPFDHQRGYHPDPFYGGIMDAYRQPKLSYYMFQAQRPAVRDSHLISETGPMIYVANAMTPFSPHDVTVYSNCDEVHLTYGKDGQTQVYKKDSTAGGMPSPIIVFKNVWDVMQDKKLDRAHRADDSYLLAEGYVHGQPVVSQLVRPARRPTHLRLRVDDDGVRLHADGSDMVTVIAEMVDDHGVVKRLNNGHVLFEVTGPGEIVGNAATFTNPKAIEWGTAPVIVKAGTQPGTLVVKARLTLEGIHTPKSATLSIPVYPSVHPLVMRQADIATSQDRDGERMDKVASQADAHVSKVVDERRRNSTKRLKEVERQQGEFE